MRFPVSIALFRCCLVVAVACAMQVRPARADEMPLPSDPEVGALIQKLQERLFQMQVDKWAITSTDPAQPLHPLGFPTDPRPVFGRVIKRDSQGVDFEADDGRILKFLPKQVYSLQAPGHFQPDYYQMSNPGGYSWMAFWALVYSEMDRKDPRMQKAMRAMIESSPPAGIYSLSFRISACSMLIRESRAQPDPEIQKTLNDDTNAMLRALLKRGDYTYRVAGNREDADGDNSNSQFAVYAIWAAAQAGMNIPYSYWNTVGKHWVDSQMPSGGWAYSRGLPEESVSMTEAGVNTLYILMDQLWGRQEGVTYMPAAGLKYRRETEGKLRLMREHIDRGWQRAFAATPSATPTPPYRLYGLQRLGLASGRKRIGSQDWYPQMLRELYGNGDVSPQETIEQICWRLLCLSFGRRPVLFNKLQIGDDEFRWNYYIRDVANLTQWLNRATERVHNWQIVSLGNELRDLRDAPILIICAETPLELADDEAAKLQRYCDLGGTIFANPVHNSSEFKQSVIKLFKKLYPECSFRAVPPEHPIFTAAGGARGGRVPRLALRSISDGGRDFVFLADGDAAGAWQSRSGMVKRDEDLHQIMLGLRLYCAPAVYEALATPLRREPPPNPRSGAAVRLARLKNEGRSSANGLLYECLDPHLAAQNQYLEARLEVSISDEAMKDADVIHITAPLAYSYSPPQAETIKRAIQRGAFLIIDPAYGRPESAQSGRDLARQLGLEVNALSVGSRPPVQSLAAKDFNDWSAIEAPRAFNELWLDGKVVGFLANVDISAAATGHFVYGNPGISGQAARQLWLNLLSHAKAKPPAATAPTP